MKNGNALTNEEKQQRFKQLQSRNYIASMRLEGIHWVEVTPTHNPKNLSEAEQIAELKLHYAR